MSDQYKAKYKQSYAWWDAKGSDVPQGTYDMVNEKFKAWEQRRGFRNEEDNTFNPENPQPTKVLRGVALRAKLGLENEKRLMAAEGVKVAKKNEKKGLKDPRKDAKFSPPIVGKRYHSGDNAKRAIRHFIKGHHLTIPEDYVFGVNKIDWGVYEVTGTRKQNNKKI